MHYVRLANLDPTRLIDSSVLPPVSFHTLYLLFANLLPMLIALSGLLVFQPAKFVFWYASLAASLVWLSVGLALNYGLTDTGNQSSALWYIVGGGACTFVCVVIGATAYAVRHVNDDADEAAEEEVRRKQKAKRAADLAFDGVRTLRFACLCVGAFTGGCALTGLFVQVPGTQRETGVLGMFGFLLLLVALVNALYFVCSLSAAGRKRVVAVETFLKGNALLGLLLLISVTYVPTIDYCVASYMCARYECPQGTVFNPRADRDEASFSRSAALYCDPCDFRDARCKADGGWLYASSPPPTVPTPSANSSVLPTSVTGSTIAPGSQTPTYAAVVEAYCPAFSSRRVWKFPEVPCDDPSLRYFFVSSGIVLFCYVLLVPVLYVRLIAVISDVLHRRVVLIPKNEDDNVEYLPPPDVYRRQVYTVEPAAASLYQPFTLQHKYFAIILLGFRLVLVAFAGVLGPWYPDWGLYSLLATHTSAVGALLYTRPFIEMVEQLFAVALELCSVTNTAFAISILHGFEPQPWFVYALLIANVVVPIVAALATFRFVRTKARRKAREAHAKHVQEMESRGELEDEAAPESLEATLLAGRPVLRAPGSPSSPPTRAGSKYLTLSHEVRSRGLKHIAIPKVVMPTPHEEEQIIEENEQLKAGLNLKTADMVTTYFAALGMLLLAAGGCSLLGYMKGARSDFPDGSTKSSRGPMPVIAGYSSFTEMTTSCCCIESMNPAAAFNTTERWLCPGHSVVVDRGRVTFDGLDNGLPIRPICGNQASIRFECEIEVNGTSDAPSVQLACPASVTDATWRQIGVSAEAVELLF